MVLRCRRTRLATYLHRLQRGRRRHRLLRRLRRGRLSLLTLLSLLSIDSLIRLRERGLRLVLSRTLRRLLSTMTRLRWLRLVVHRVAHRALYLLRGYLLIGCLRGRYLLIHRLVLLLLQYLPPNLTRTTARRAQRREKRYRRADQNKYKQRIQACCAIQRRRHRRRHDRQRANKSENSRNNPHDFTITQLNPGCSQRRCLTAY